MATLPRYETMGVQYADLPRVSTAPQQVAAEGFSRLSQNIDRMTSFIQTELETRAQREARKYAVENPLTKEQIDTALREGRGVRVEGAGEIFQQTYEATQGALLASQLQAEGERKIGTALAKIKQGGQIDLQQTQADLKDMIDGYAATVMALDPERSIKLRAALTLAGNTLFETAAGEAQKREMAALNAEIMTSVQESVPIIEATISRAGTLDPVSGKPINVDEMIEAQRQKLYGLIRVTGNVKPLEEFNQKVRDAKLGAIVSKATSAEFAENSLDALNKLASASLDNLTDVYKGLPTEDKETIRKRVRDAFNDKRAAEEAQRREDVEKAKTAQNILELEYLDPKTTQQRRRQIEDQSVAGGFWTVQQVEDLRKPRPKQPDVMTELRLKEEIARGRITDLNQVITYANRLTDSQFESVGNYLRDQTYRSADQALNRAAGIVGFELNPGEAKIIKRTDLESRFKAALQAGNTPLQASEIAIRGYSTDSTVKANENRREAITKQVRDALTAKGFAMPEVSVDQMNLNAIKDGRGRPLPEAMSKEILDLQSQYRSTLAGAPTAAPMAPPPPPMPAPMPAPAPAPAPARPAPAPAPAARAPAPAPRPPAPAPAPARAPAPALAPAARIESAETAESLVKGRTYEVMTRPGAPAGKFEFTGVDPNNRMDRRNWKPIVGEVYSVSLGGGAPRSMVYKGGDPSKASSYVAGGAVTRGGQ